MTVGPALSRRKALALLGGLGATHLLNACSPGRGASPPTAAPPLSRPVSTSSATSQAAPVRPVPSAATPTIRAQSNRLKAVPRDRTFVSVGVGGEAPGRFTDIEMQNPFLPGISRSGYQVVMEPLFYYNPYHTATVCGPSSVPQCNEGEIPWLAVYYSYDADYTAALINIRQGVTWSDGQPFTAHDVVFTVNMLKDNAPDLQWSIDMQQWVKDVVALDPFTVQFTMTRPNPHFIFSYFMFHEDFGIQIVPQHIFDGKDPRTFANFDLARGWPVVTGPYRLVYSDAQQKIWDRRDDWWGATAGFQSLPEVERMIFLPGYPETRMVDMIDKNDVDTTLGLRLDNIRQAVTGNPKVSSWTGMQAPHGYVDYWVTGLGFNDEKSPFDDAQIRGAINDAINRDELVARGYGGSGQTAVLPYPDFPALRPFLNGVSDLVKQYSLGTYNPKRSAQILTSKGYARNRAGLWTRNGASLKIPIVTFSAEQDIIGVLVDQLRRAGFDASYTLPTDYRNPIYNGTASAYVFGHAGSVRDPYVTMRLYQSAYAAPTGRRAVQPYRWRNAQFDEIVDRMGTVAASNPQMESLFHQALEVWLKNLPDIPLVQFYHRIPVNTTYWTGWPDATNPYINTANWHRTFELVILNLKHV